MGHLSASILGGVVSIVLLLQVVLHTQLLHRNPETISSDNLSNDLINQYAESTVAGVGSVSSEILHVNTNANTVARKKRFLRRNEQSANADGSIGVKSIDNFKIVPVNNNNGEVDSNNKDSNSISVEDNIVTTVLTTSPSSLRPWDGVSPDLKIEKFYNGKFIEPNKNLCSRKGNNISVVILIPSAIANFQQRDSVRKTWGSFALRKDVVVGFMIGNPKLSDANDTLMDTFQTEKDLYEDVVIADFKDSYQNLTLKVLYMLKWTYTYCTEAKFFMKTDDDVFLNVPLVLNFISKIQENDNAQPKIYGNVFSGHMPQRNTRHKHHVNFDVYPHDIKYPNFTSGPAYLVSAKVLRPLVKQAVKLPLFNLEDVFLTGFVASSLDIPRIYVPPFRNELENPFNMPACKLVNTIAGMTDGSSTQIYYVWYNYLMGRFICKHLKPR